MGVIALSFFILLMYSIFKFEWLKFTSLLLLILSQIIFMFAPLIEIYQSRSKIIKSFKIPFNHAININVKSEIIIDNKKLTELISLNKQELELGLMEIKHERTCLEKRMSIITGPIEKLGMLPTLITTLVTLSKITEPYSWVSAIAYGYMGLIFISLMFHQILMRYDRMINLTEIAIKNR